tara:strand:- start:57312 stop:57662 length:351 start_codon:yes stop_codon:yes gene_type:complete
MNQQTIYWLTRLDSIKDLLGWLTFFGILVALACCAFTAFLSDEEASEVKWRNRFLLIPILSIGFPVVLATANVFIPTTKEAAAIIALPAIANNADVQEIGADIMELSKQWLQELKK